jgi:hypothetical protein
MGRDRCAGRVAAGFLHRQRFPRQATPPPRQRGTASRLNATNLWREGQPPAVRALELSANDHPPQDHHQSALHDQPERDHQTCDITQTGTADALAGPSRRCSRAQRVVFPMAAWTWPKGTTEYDRFCRDGWSTTGGMPPRGGARPGRRLIPVRRPDARANRQSRSERDARGPGRNERNQVRTVAARGMTAIGDTLPRPQAPPTTADSLGVQQGYCLKPLLHGRVAGQPTAYSPTVGGAPSARRLVSGPTPTAPPRWTMPPSRTTSCDPRESAPASSALACRGSRLDGRTQPPDSGMAGCRGSS